MKKLILFTAGICFATFTWAQKQNIQTANNYLNDKEYDKAIEHINLATNDPSTKDNAKAWYVKGRIYMAMQQDEAKKAAKPYREAASAFMKAAQLDPKFEKEEINQALLVAAYNYYNDAVGQYNAKKFDEAYTLAKGTVDIYSLEGSKRFAGNKSFDTVASQALVLQAFSAYYSKKYDEALPALLALKADPIGRSANVYLSLADLYKAQNKDSEILPLLEEGRKLYPENESLRNEELNYYIKAGKQDVLLKKLEEAVAKDANNAELHFNLANIYTGVAFPKDAAKPANYTELIGKAEASYTKALALDANNGGYNYNMGVLYYNQASDINKEINAEADLTNKAKPGPEKKKHEDAYNQLITKRDAIFDKAIPYFEKSVAVLEPKVGSLNADDKFSYQSALAALREIYARKNNMDKSNEMKKKLEESRKK